MTEKTVSLDELIAWHENTARLWAPLKRPDTEAFAAFHTAAAARLQEVKEAGQPFGDVPTGRESFSDDQAVEVPVQMAFGRVTQNVKRARLLMREFRALRKALGAPS